MNRKTYFKDYYRMYPVPYGVEQHFFLTSVVDPNTLNIDPDPGFVPNLDPDPGLYYCIHFERKFKK